MLSSFKNQSSFWDDFLGLPLTGWGRPLALQRRGNFFNDSLFHDTRSHFDSAVRDVVQSFDFSKRDNDFASYRQLRDRHLTGADRAATLTEEQDKFKIVMDVHGFIENDLKVTFLNDNELIIEGHIEKKDEVSFARQTFKRRFLLPGKINVNETTSALSSDHVLTIVIPKLFQQSITGTESLSTNTTEIQNKQMSSLEQQIGSLSMSQPQTPQQQIPQVQPQMVPQVQTQVNQAQQLQSQIKQETTSLEKAFENIAELPIVQRQDFFGDSFFENVRNQFQSRVKEIMDRKFERTDMEALNVYKKFREKDDNTVAVTVSGDSKEHKIVLDVHGFSEGDLKVKAVSANELVVEGRVEKKSDNSYCKNSFTRKFCLPDAATIKETTSALSSDGVLTITVPKQEKLLPLEYSIPITKEEVTRKTSKSKTVTAQTTQESQQSKERIVPIALGYKDNYSSCIQEEKQEATQFLSSNTSTHAKQNLQETPNTKMIPISLAGSFFQDSVFDSAKRRVETAIRDAISRSSSVTSEQQEVPTPQPVQPVVPVEAIPKHVVSTGFAEDATSYKIILDVHGYSENELRIKTTSQEIVIEGNAKRKKEGCFSKQSFQKRFTLPGDVITDQAVSALSSEGMLTITFPKKVQQPLPTSEHIIPVSIESPSATPSENLSRGTSVLSDVSTVTSVQESQTQQKESMVPLTLGQDDMTRRLQSQTESLSSVMDSKSQSQAIQKRNDLFTHDSLFDSEFFKDVPTKIHSDLPIAPRGHFYQDSFFNDSRGMFESALKGVMSRFSSFPTFTDDVNVFKSLREQNLAAQTPAEASAEDQQSHKIVLDVQGYKDSDLKIQVLEGNGLSVEGSSQEKGQGVSSSKSFKKCFFLPDGFKMNEASTGLSSDGVLTVKIPKANTQAIGF